MDPTDSIGVLIADDDARHAVKEAGLEGLAGVIRTSPPG